MASTQDYVTYVMDSIQGIGRLRYKKMFGEYMIYVDDKPTLLICDDTVFIKKIDACEDAFFGCETGNPYEGAKLYYILDIDDKDKSKELISLVLPYLKIPKLKTKMSKI